MFLTAESILSLVVLASILLAVFVPAPNTGGAVSFVQKNDEVTVLFETRGFCGEHAEENCLNIRYYFCEDGRLHRYCVN